MKKLLNKFNSALLLNKTAKQTILKNTFWLAASQGIERLGVFFLTVLLAWRLGDELLGKFAVCLSFAMLFSTVFDCGLATAVTREFAKDRQKEKAIGPLVLLKLLLGAAAMTIIIAIAIFTRRGDIRILTIVLAGYVFAMEMVNFFYAVFRARQKMEAEALGRTLQIVLLVLLVGSVLLFYSSILYAGWAYLLAALIVAAVLAGMAGTKSGNFAGGFNNVSKTWYDFLRIGLFIALARGLGDVMMNIDSVMLGHYEMFSQAGWYNAAMRVNRLALFPMGLVSAAVFPALSSFAGKNNEMFRRLYLRWFRASIYIAAMVSAVIFSNAQHIIRILFPDEFTPAVKALQILIIMTIIVCIHTLYYHILLIYDKQKYIFAVMTAGAAVNIVLNYILIPKYGLYGAASATVVTHAVMLVLFALLMSCTSVSIFSVKLLLDVLIAVAASALSFSASVYSGKIISNPAVPILAGITAYAAVAMLLGAAARVLNTADKT